MHFRSYCNRIKPNLCTTDKQKLKLFPHFCCDNIYALTRSMYCWTSSSAVAPSSSSSSSPSSSFCPSPNNCNCLLAQLLTPTVRNALEYQQRIILAIYIYKYTTDHTHPISCVLETTPIIFKHASLFHHVHNYYIACRI